MLPLGRISALKATLDDDWCSPVADDVAAAFGYQPGAALFWRSSACHVFVARDHPGAAVAYLRFAPADVVDRSAVTVVADLMQTLAGNTCATILASDAGNLVETVTTSLGPMHATLVAQAPGSSLDADDLTPAQARAWGSALARLHRDGTPAAGGLDLPDGRLRVAHALDQADGDPGLAPAVPILRRRLDSLSAAAGDVGLVHGDFELDNIAWDGDVATAYDWDEAERSWFAADIAYAVRDLMPDARSWADPPNSLLQAFLTGYRAELPASRVGRDQLMLFTAVNAVRSVQRLRPVLEEDPSAGADLVVGTGESAIPLRQRLERYDAQQRSLVAELSSMLDVG